MARVEPRRWKALARGRDWNGVTRGAVEQEEVATGHEGSGESRLHIELEVERESFATVTTDRPILSPRQDWAPAGCRPRSSNWPARGDSDYVHDGPGAQILGSRDGVALRRRGLRVRPAYDAFLFFLRPEARAVLCWLSLPAARLAELAAGGTLAAFRSDASSEAETA